MKLIKYFSITLLALMLPRVTIARPNIDSLERALPGMKDDTVKLSVLSLLSKAYADADPQKGVNYSQEVIALAQELNSKQGLAAGYNSLGAAYKSMAKYPKALENLLKSLKINEDLGKKENMARTLGNIGNLYRELKNYPKALDYLNRALDLNQQLGRKIGVTTNLSDIGIVYAMRNENSKALEYFNKALKISEDMNDLEGVAIVYGNIANTYSEMKDASQAIKYSEMALDINDSLKRGNGIATNLTNLGDLYYRIAIDSAQKMSVGTLSRDKKLNLEKAISYYKRAIPIYEAATYIDGLMSVYQSLADAYKENKEYQAAYDARTKYAIFKDSVVSTDNKVKIANLGAERAEYEKTQQVKLKELTDKKRRNEAILFTIGIISVLVFAIFVTKERRRSEKLLLNILPAEVATELKQTGRTTAKHFDNITVFFSDFVNFTSAAERMTPADLVNELHACFKVFDEIMAKYNIEKIKTIGDAYMAVAGLPAAHPNHAEHVVNAAIEVQQFVEERRKQKGNDALNIRIGVHSGSVVAGVVGVKKFAYDIWGDTVNMAARMEQASTPGKINISQATYDIVKNKFECTYRGEHEVKHKGKMAMYFVENKTPVA